MSPEKIRELEEMFLKECTDIKDSQDANELDSESMYYPIVIVTPKKCFQWIVDNVIKAKEEATGEPGVDRGGVDYCPNCGRKRTWRNGEFTSTCLC